MRGTILVVDDEEDLCQLLTASLKREGYQAVAARSGVEALALAEDERPDLIVLDLMMPGLNGIETLRQIRERVGAVKVVILTAYGTALRAREAMALGVREFLGKPFDLDRFVKLVADEMGRTT